MEESDVFTLVDQWLDSNQLDWNKVRYGSYPIGFVVRWIERAQAAEQKLASLTPMPEEGCAKSTKGCVLRHVPPPDAPKPEGVEDAH